MRTTLTIDEDIALKLKIEMQNQGNKSFKEIINETLRRGLIAKKEVAKSIPFELKTYRLETNKNVNFDNIGELLEQIEGADFK